MHRFALLFGTAVLTVGCSVIAPSPSSTAGSTATTPSAPRSTPRPTPTAVPIGSCPTTSPLTVAQFTDADRACFDGVDVEIRGWLDKPPAFGFEPPGIEPGWLFYPRAELSTIWEGLPTRTLDGTPTGDCVGMGDQGCAYLIWHRDPAAVPALEGPPRWLIVVGHVNDPLAETCHYVYPEDWNEPPEDDAVAVGTCREGFVIVSFRDAP